MTCDNKYSADSFRVLSHQVSWHTILMRLFFVLDQLNTESLTSNYSCTIAANVSVKSS